MTELPIVFAFTAGLFATINPCGWAMLPAFVAYYLGTREEGYQDRGVTDRAYEGLTLGLLVTAGFLVIFGGIGLVISAGLKVVVQFMPYLALGVGFGLVLLGFSLFAGRSLPIAFPQPELNLDARNSKTVFLFGAAYGFASLSCTLPVFLAVVGAGLATASFAATGVLFLTYGIGMAVVLIGVAVGAALFKGTVARSVGNLLPYVNRVGAVLLVLAGLYLLWYQGRYLPFVLAGL